MLKFNFEKIPNLTQGLLRTQTFMIENSSLRQIVRLEKLLPTSRFSMLLNCLKLEKVLIEGSWTHDGLL